MISPSTLIDTIFNENATAYDLLQIVFAIAIFWAVSFQLAAAVMRPLVVGNPRIKAAGEREYEHSIKELHKKLGISMTKEEYLEHFTSMVPWNLTVALQHLIGGALCIPAVFNIGNPKVTSSLACLGILSEMGWEIEDTVVWLYKRFISKKGAVPDVVLIILIFHHTLTTVLGVPMILNYRNLDILHMLTFDLQIIAGLSLGVTEYTKLLDVTKKHQLAQFRLLTFLVCVGMIFTRGFHWSYLCTKLILVWYNDKAWEFLVIGSVLILIFSMFNYFFCINVFCKRFVKFMKLSEEHNALPADTSERTRRQSETNLKISATGVYKNSHVIEADFSSLFVESKADRRKTLPPSMYGNAQAAKRASLIMSRSVRGSYVFNIYAKIDGGDKNS